MQEMQIWSQGWEYPMEEGMVTTPVFLPEESHGQRSLVGHSPWDQKGLDSVETIYHSAHSQTRREH